MILWVYEEGFFQQIEVVRKDCKLQWFKSKNVTKKSEKEVQEQPTNNRKNVKSLSEQIKSEEACWKVWLVCKTSRFLGCRRIIWRRYNHRRNYWLVDGMDELWPIPILANFFKGSNWEFMSQGEVEVERSSGTDFSAFSFTSTLASVGTGTLLIGHQLFKGFWRRFWKL